MATKKISKEEAAEYVTPFRVRGEEGFYQHSIETFSDVLKEHPTADTQFLELSEAFFSLYRTTGQEEYFSLGRVFRRVAHTLNRQLLTLIKGKKPNFKKFLLRVK